MSNNWALPFGTLIEAFEFLSGRVVDRHGADIPLHKDSFMTGAVSCYALACEFGLSAMKDQIKDLAHTLDSAPPKH